MCPGIAQEQVVYHAPGYAVLAPDGSLIDWESKPAYGQHLFFRKLREALSGAARIAIAIQRITSIVERGTKLQVVRVYTRRVVALVSHHLAMRNRTKYYLPRDTVRHLPAPAEDNESIWQLSSARCPTGLPFPAFFGTALIDFTPKSCDRLLIHGVNSCGSSPGRVVATRGSLLGDHLAREGST